MRTNDEKKEIEIGCLISREMATRAAKGQREREDDPRAAIVPGFLANWASFKRYRRWAHKWACINYSK